MDILRDVLSRDYQPAYDMAVAELKKSGLCAACVRKLALSQVLASALKVAEERTRINIQLAEHGVVVIEGDAIGPCLV